MARSDKTAGTQYFSRRLGLALELYLSHDCDMAESHTVKHSEDQTGPLHWLLCAGVARQPRHYFLPARAISGSLTDTGTPCLSPVNKLGPF
jgi:hypothetical protein